MQSARSRRRITPRPWPADDAGEPRGPQPPRPHRAAAAQSGPGFDPPLSIYVVAADRFQLPASAHLLPLRRGGARTIRPLGWRLDDTGATIALQSLRHVRDRQRSGTRRPARAGTCRGATAAGAASTGRPLRRPSSIAILAASRIDRRRLARSRSYSQPSRGATSPMTPQPSKFVPVDATRARSPRARTAARSSVGPASDRRANRATMFRSGPRRRLSATHRPHRRAVQVSSTGRPGVHEQPQQQRGETFAAAPPRRAIVVEAKLPAREASYAHGELKNSRGSTPKRNNSRATTS